MKLVIIDGQGGGVGKALVQAVKAVLPTQPIIAVGTNALATAAMLKAGADQGATGENAVCRQCARADVVLGALGVIVSGAMLGEITPRIAAAVGESDAQKILLPLNRCAVTVAGARRVPLEAAIRDAMEILKSIIGGMEQ